MVVQILNKISTLELLLKNKENTESFENNVNGVNVYSCTNDCACECRCGGSCGCLCLESTEPLIDYRAFKLIREEYKRT